MCSTTSNPELLLSIVLSNLQKPDGQTLARLAIVSKHMSSCVRHALSKFDYTSFLFDLPNGRMLALGISPKKLICSQCKRFKPTFTCPFVSGGILCEECLGLRCTTRAQAQNTFKLRPHDLVKLDYYVLKPNIYVYKGTDVKKLSYLKHKGALQPPQSHQRRTAQLNDLINRLIPSEAHDKVKATAYCMEFITTGGAGLRALENYLSGYTTLSKLVAQPELYMREYAKNSIHAMYQIAKEKRLYK
jgi:hypothetical protein